MGKKKRKPQRQRLSSKDESEKESQASPGAHSGLPQSSASQSQELLPEETLKKQMGYVKLSESLVQKDVQQYPGPLSGAKPKTSAYGGSEQTKQKDGSLPIYTVSSFQEKVGKSGRKIPLRVNHFPMNINVPGGVIYHYDVNFIFTDKKEVKKSDRKLLLEAIQRLKGKYPEIFNHAVVFDGFKNVYTRKKLGFSSGEFQSDVEIKASATYLMVPEVKVILKYVRRINVDSAVTEYCRRGTTETKPDDVIQALNIVLNMTPQLHHETFGLNHFNPNTSNGTSIDIGGGAYLWVGTFTSVRLGWKPMLNVDVPNKVGCEESSVIEFIENILKSNRGYHHSHILLNDKTHRDTVDDKMKDLRIHYSRPNGYKRNYRVIKLMPAANKLKVKLGSGEECTIEKYFMDKYKYQLKFPDYRCIHVGKKDDKIYLPIELCRIKKQFLPLCKCLDDYQNQNMINAAAKLPKERRELIERNLKHLSNHYESDPYANDFGLKVSGEMMKVEGRVLGPPALKYKNEDEFREVENGKWKVGRRGDKIVLRFLKPMNLKYWGILDLSNLPGNAKEKFVDRIRSEGNMRGMFVDNPSYENADIRNTSQVKDTFKKLYNDVRRKKENKEGSKENGSKLLILVINPKQSTIKDQLKYLGDTILKIPTQFVLKTNVTGRDNNGPSYQVLHNLCLKMNHKLGGVNHALSKGPPLMNEAVMVMGADVTHPASGDNAKKPSIAAVVGSADLDFCQFNVEIRLQRRTEEKSKVADKSKDKVRAVEEIQEMENIVHSLLSKFYQKRKRYPEQIIYYRDGVSEGQFPGILKHELSAIRRAYAKLKGACEPKVTFVIAQKRHKTRLFVENLNDGIGKTKNIPPGTVVDKDITSLLEIDFFLASHEGIKVVILQFLFFKSQSPGGFL